MLRVTGKRSLGVLVMVLAIAVWVAAAAGAAEAIQLRLMLRGGNPEREAFAKETIAAFERLHPEIQVEWEMAGSGWTDQMVVQYAGGVAPDVTEMYSTFSQEWAESGMLLDLRPYIERDLSSADTKDFFPPIWNAGTLYHGEHKGIFYGVPRYVNLAGTFVYNRNMMEEAGLAPIEDLDADANWNWESFRQYAIKLTKKDGEGNVTQWGLAAPITSRWKSWVMSAGGKLFDYPQDPYAFMLDEPEALKGLEFYQSLVQDDQVVVHDWGSLFSQGKAAMSSTGIERYAATFPSEIADAFEWDIAPRPVGPGGRGVYSAKDQYGVISNTKHPDAAWELVKFLISAEGQRVMLRTSGLMPIRISLIPEYIELMPDRNANYVVDAVQEAVIDPMAVLVQSKRVGSLINGAVRESIVDNKQPVSLSIRQIAPAIRDIMREAKSGR